ncbi:MAG: DNA-binding IclR family transcriptional regulator, partial [Oceanospirillaceae bacterium]
KGSLIAGIKKARALGYAFESEENEAGIVCFGGAIYDAKSNPSASVSVSIPMYRLKSDTSHYYLALQQACLSVSKQLGYTG